MTPSPMPTRVLKMIALSVAAVLMFGIAINWLDFRDDRVDPNAAYGSVRIVAASSNKLDTTAAPPSRLPIATPDHDPATALQELVTSSFPRLSNVTTRCTKQACEVDATTTVPEDGQGLAEYEKMIRSDLPIFLHQHNNALSEAPQIEDIGDGDVRVLLHTNSGR